MQRSTPAARTRRTTLLASALLACSGLAEAAARTAPGGAPAPREPLALPAMPAPVRDDSLLVIAPHPDDETLCCAGIIQRALQAGARVTVAWVTSGDAFELDAVIVERTLRPKGANLRRLAETRMREAECAATRLGIPPAQRFFLGYPDGGTRTLLHAAYAVPFRSPHTGAASVPYTGTLAPGSSYEGRNLERDLDRVIAAAAPTIVLAPGTQDRHPDHAAVAEFVERALARRDGAVQLYSWIVHARGHWPRPRGFHPLLEASPPNRLRALDWRRFPLTAEERAAKRLALECHRTQMRVMPSLMLAFDRADEIFARTPRMQPAADAPNPRASDSSDAGLDQNGAH